VGRSLSGRLLFFLGGVFNYWRAYIVVRNEIAARKALGATRLPRN
jgi:hypothetical protein